jgi:hypothetical protein
VEEVVGKNIVERGGNRIRHRRQFKNLSCKVTAEGRCKSYGEADSHASTKVGPSTCSAEAAFLPCVGEACGPASFSTWLARGADHVSCILEIVLFHSLHCVQIRVFNWKRVVENLN